MEQSPAIQYSQKVSSSIQELVELYNTLLGLSRGLESNLTGKQKIKISGYTQQQYSDYGEQVKRSATFPEQLEIIRIYIERLEGGNLTNQEWIIFENADLMDGFDWHGMADFIEPYVQWLKDVISQCEEILRIQYQPGGAVFQQLQEKNVKTYGIGL